MDEKDASELINFTPRSTDIVTRLGSREHADGMISSVLSAGTLKRQNGAETVICAANNFLYNATTFGASATSLAATTSNAWQFQQFLNVLVCVNGVNAPRQWDGTTLGAPTWSGSGLTTSNLIDVTAHKSRLWFIESNTGNAWYGGLRATTGTLTQFPVDALISGALFAICTISRQTPAGDSSQLVFISDVGDVLVYDGDVTTSLILVARAKIPRLVSRRSYVLFGQDVLFLTTSGLISLSSVLATPVNNVLTNKINERLVKDIQLTGNLFGWDMLFVPDLQLIYINVPLTSTTSKQYVFNVSNGAFAEYRGMNAFCWALFKNKPFFGTTGGRLFESDFGFSDASTPISYKAVSAPTFLGARGTKKRVSRIKPTLRFSTSTSPRFTLYPLDDPRGRQSVVPCTLNATLWSSPWGSPWGSDESVKSDWVVTSGYAEAYQLELSGELSTGQIRYQGCRFLFEQGNSL
jgi:hypothetical protein